MRTELIDVDANSAQNTLTHYALVIVENPTYSVMFIATLICLPVPGV